MIIIAVLFIAVFSIKFLIKPKINTIDDLHLLNVQGKLKPEQGYMYGGFSFIRANDLWYTQIQVGNILIDIPLHYGPKDMENMPVEGAFNTALFDASNHVFMTFNPLGDYLTYVALATGEIDNALIKAFGKAVIGSCDRNETEPCAARPIVTCSSTDKLVLYVKEANNSGVYFDDNCIVVEGNGFDLVKGVDRVLYDFYGIIK